MRIAIAVLWIIYCVPAFAQKETGPPKSLKLIGDETSLIRVKAEPQTFLGKPFVMTGGVRVSDYYNYDYNKAQTTHYSLNFRQASSPTELGEDCSLYLRREVGKEIVESIISKSTDNKLIRIRVKVVLDPARFGDKKWDMFELLDVQFARDDGADWHPWVIETQRAVAAEAAAKAAERKRQDDLRAKEAKEQDLEKQRASRTRTWTDPSGKFSVVAEYAGVIGDKVALRKQNGEVVKVSIDRLSEADQKWLTERRKNPKR